MRAQLCGRHHAAGAACCLQTCSCCLCRRLSLQHCTGDHTQPAPFKPTLFTKRRSAAISQLPFDSLRCTPRTITLRLLRFPISRSPRSKAQALAPLPFQRCGLLIISSCPSLKQLVHLMLLQRRLPAAAGRRLGLQTQRLRARKTAGRQAGMLRAERQLTNAADAGRAITSFWCQHTCYQRRLSQSRAACPAPKEHQQQIDGHRRGRQLSQRMAQKSEGS